eukprot:11193194-Lingulodinium_polyedra.AAC.1
MGSIVDSVFDRFAATAASVMRRLQSAGSPGLLFCRQCAGYATGTVVCRLRRKRRAAKDPFS